MSKHHKRNEDQLIQSKAHSWNQTCFYVLGWIRSCRTFRFFFQNLTPSAPLWRLTWSFGRPVWWTMTLKLKVKPPSFPVTQSTACFEWNENSLSPSCDTVRMTYPLCLVHFSCFFPSRGPLPARRAAQAAGRDAGAEEPAAAGPERLPAQTGWDRERVRPIAGKTGREVHLQAQEVKKNNDNNNNK